jgi:hypothetical protein
MRCNAPGPARFIEASNAFKASVTSTAQVSSLCESGGGTVRLACERSKAMSEIEGRVKYLSDEEKKKDFDMSDKEVEESDKAVAEEEEAANSSGESLTDKAKDVIEGVKEAIKKDDSR